MNLDGELPKWATELLATGEPCVSLALWNEGVGDRGALALANALKTNWSTIQTLKLGDNKIGDHGLRSLAQALTSDRCMLTSLDIGVKLVRGGGAYAMPVVAALASEHCKLKDLDLAGNIVGAAGARALAAALVSGHCSLECLNLANTGIGEDGIHELADAVRLGHSVVRNVYVHHEVLQPIMDAAIAEGQRRRQLRHSGLLVAVACWLAGARKRAAEVVFHPNRVGFTIV